MTDRVTALQTMFAPVVEAMGCRLWGIEYNSQGKYSVLRVYIEKEGGTDVEDCVQISRQISGILDVEDPISGEYTLEVSSPGMDRPLFTLEQYADYTGHGVKVQLRTPFEGQRKFSGTIAGVENDEVLLRQGDEQLSLPFELIEKAHIVARF